MVGAWQGFRGTGERGIRIQEYALMQEDMQLGGHEILLYIMGCSTARGSAVGITDGNA